MAPTAMRSVTAVSDCARKGVADGNERLSHVIGRTRARVLVTVGEPQTTEQVAQLVGAATSSASEHLTALHRVGLVTRRRAGRRVYYQLSARGRGLLEVLRDDP